VFLGSFLSFFGLFAFFVAFLAFFGIFLAEFFLGGALAFFLGGFTFLFVGQKLGALSFAFASFVGGLAFSESFAQFAFGFLHLLGGLRDFLLGGELLSTEFGELSLNGGDGGAEIGAGLVEFSLFRLHVFQRRGQSYQLLVRFFQFHLKSLLEFQVLNLFLFLVQILHFFAQHDDVFFHTFHLLVVRLQDFAYRNHPSTFFADLLVSGKNIGFNSFESGVQLIQLRVISFVFSCWLGIPDVPGGTGTAGQLHAWGAWGATP